jgi:parallel beta-helix repeat protein
MGSVGLRLLAVVVVALAAPAPGRARAETTACQVLDTLPVTISAPGHYCLDHDFAQDFAFESPIRIQADDVVLDCNDHRIRQTNAANSGSAIYGPGEREHVTIRHCVLEGWDTGIFLQASTDPGANGNRIESNTVLRSRTTAIYVIGSNNLIEGNLVAQNTGANNGVAYGIFVYSMDRTGVGNTIRGNTVTDFKPVSPTGNTSVTPIGVSNLRNTEVSNNIISAINSTGEYGVIGITGYNANGTTVSGNVILTPRAPGAAPWTAGHWYGIYLPGTAEEMASNVCRDNVIGHFNLAVYGCTIDQGSSF